MDRTEFRTLNIMVVDDELFIRNLVARMLRDLKVGEVHTANDGSDALCKLQELADKLDLVVCDLEMPGMDGFDFVKTLRQLGDERLACLPVLILTGHADQENVEMAVRLGIHGFVAKPVSLAVLEARLAKALSAPAIDPARLGLRP
ncbi:response regulator [Magnetospirillum aberrantis]|uniref:Response regulator n=1 Tax=Magnetospirillum aberrantis SpK TaxID=908842 RepID=A0A7C9UXP9_9PROT|nr:response regulator [Magnetospirillum aberrantis]NFV79193.1 response regulator [Magnetospirillum aberrantis SpK]